MTDAIRFLYNNFYQYEMVGHNHNDALYVTEHEESGCLFIFNIIILLQTLHTDK